MRKSLPAFLSFVALAGLAIGTALSQGAGSASAAPSPCAPGSFHRGRHCVTSSSTTASTTTSSTSIIVTTTSSSSSSSSPAGNPSSCAYFASPSGSDSAQGTQSAPFATPTKLEETLRAGQKGCLESGTYGGTGSTWSFEGSGNSSASVELTAAAGATPVIEGLLLIDGSYVDFNGLTIDGSNTAYNAERSGTTCPYPISNGMEINGSDDTLENSTFYQSVASLRGNGIGIGWNGASNNDVIRYDKIYNVGLCDDFDHILYLSSGSGTRIYDNWVYNDQHGWGVQIYPFASNASVYSNVIDDAGSGVVFASSGPNDTFYNNVVTNSTGIVNRDTGQDDPGVGVTCLELTSGDQIYNNDFYNNPGGASTGCGSAISGSADVNPEYANASAGDYRVQNSALAGYGLWDGSQ